MYIDRHHITVRALRELSPKLKFTISSKMDSDGNILNEIDWDSYVVDEVQDSDGILRPTLDQINSRIDLIIAGRDLELIRNKRDTLIAETDWWASNDLTMDSDRAAYRQALRDMPQNYSTFDSAEDNWPIKPS